MIVIRDYKSRTVWRKKIGLEEDSFVVVKVANITQAKDHRTVLKAWKIVLDSWKLDNKPILLFAGRLEYTYEELKLLVKELGLENHVFFLDMLMTFLGFLIARILAFLVQ